jgi:hypothetical protein
VAKISLGTTHLALCAFGWRSGEMGNWQLMFPEGEKSYAASLRRATNPASATMGPPGAQRSRAAFTMPILAMLVIIIAKGIRNRPTEEASPQVFL